MSQRGDELWRKVDKLLADLARYRWLIAEGDMRMMGQIWMITTTQPDRLDPFVYEDYR